MGDKVKSNRHIVHMRSNIHYIEVQHEYLLCVNLKNYKSLTLYQALFSTRLEQLPFYFVFKPFIILNHRTRFVFDLLDVLIGIIERLIRYVPRCHIPLRFFPLSNKTFQFSQVPL